MPTYWCDVCGIPVTHNTSSISIIKEKHEGTKRHRQKEADAELYQNCFKCGANKKIRQDASGLLRSTLGEHVCSISDDDFYSGEFQLSDAMQAELKQPHSKAQYDEAVEKFNSWSDVDPTKITPEEEPEKEPLKRYTQDELMAMEHAELVKMYIRLQEEGCREPEPKKVNSYDRRKSGEQTFKFYFLVDKANPLKLYYAGSTDTLAAGVREDEHRQDFEKIKRMLGPGVDVTNRFEIEVLRGRTYNQVSTMEHCFQMQQRRSASAHAITAQQRLPFKCLGENKWVKVLVPEYTRVVLKIGIYKLREAFGGEAATALLLPEDADLSYEFETSKDAERSDDGQESDDEDEEEVPSPVLKTDAEPQPEHQFKTHVVEGNSAASLPTTASVKQEKNPQKRPAMFPNALSEEGRKKIKKTKHVGPTVDQYFTRR